MNLVTLPLATPSQLPPYVASKTRMAFAGFFSPAVTLPTGEQRIMRATNPSAQPLCIHWFRDLYRGAQATEEATPVSCCRAPFQSASQRVRSTRERPPTRGIRGPSALTRCRGIGSLRQHNRHLRCQVPCSRLFLVRLSRPPDTRSRDALSGFPDRQPTARRRLDAPCQRAQGLAGNVGQALTATWRCQ